MIEQQQNISPNQNQKQANSGIKNQEFNFSKKSPELVDLIRQNMTYQNNQTIHKTLMKESMMKISLDKDFQDLFNHHGQVLNDKNQEKCVDTFLEVSQQIKNICEWLEDSQQYAGMAHLPLNSYLKFFHVLHQKVDSVAIVVTEYPIYYLSKMQNLTRLSKLKWAFLNNSLEQEQKVKVLQMYQLKKLKLLFVSPTMFRTQQWIDFESELLVICDIEQYKGETEFINSIISKTKPGRVLSLYPTLLQSTLEEHSKNNFKIINKVNSSNVNYIVLKCQKDQKQKTVLSYLAKNPQSIKKTLILINKRSQAAALNKKMTMDSKTSVNLFDYLTYSDLNSFNAPDLFNKTDKIKEQQKIIQTLKRVKNSEIIISTYSDILKFQNFDLVVFFSFTDVKKYVQCCPMVKNKLLLFDEDDYHNVRNSITSQYINYNHLVKNVVKIIEKSQKKQNQTKKRFYSDYIDDKMLNCYSISKQLIQKDQQKTIKINSFCKTNQITSKTFMRLIQSLIQIEMIQVNCRVVYQIQIQEDSLNWFRKCFGELTQVRRKVNLLNSSSLMKKTTKSLLQQIKKLNIKYKITEQALQIKVLKNYEDINWQILQKIINKQILNIVNTFDLSLQVFKDCAYSSIELTRRQKVLQRKESLLKFSENVQVEAKIASEQNINESYHRSNLLTSEVEQYLRSCQQPVTDQHELVMLLQGVERGRNKQKQEWIFGRYRKLKYQQLKEAVERIFKSKKVKRN